MNAAFLVDECLPREVTSALRRRGHDAVDVVELGLRGLADEAIWNLAAREGRILVSSDLDFPLRLVGARPAGLVLLRARDLATPTFLAGLLEALLDALPAGELLDHVTVVSAGRFRRRPWP